MVRLAGESESRSGEALDGETFYRFLLTITLLSAQYMYIQSVYIYIYIYVYQACVRTPHRCMMYSVYTCIYPLLSEVRYVRIHNTRPIPSTRHSQALVTCIIHPYCDTDLVGFPGDRSTV